MGFRFTWFLALANVFAALAGGWVLAKSPPKLAPSPFLDEFGPLTALVLGSLLSVFVLRALREAGLRVTRFLPLATAGASLALLLFSWYGGLNETVAWLSFVVLSVRWTFWAAGRSVRGALAAAFGRNPVVELCSYLGLAVGAVLPVYLGNVSGEDVLLADIALQLLAFAIDYTGSRLKDLPRPSTETHEYPLRPGRPVCSGHRGRHADGAIRLEGGSAGRRVQAASGGMRVPGRVPRGGPIHLAAGSHRDAVAEWPVGRRVPGADVAVAFGLAAGRLSAGVRSDRGGRPRS